MPPVPPPFCRLLKCLEKARRSCEKIASKERVFNPYILTGFCAKGSVILYKILEKEGFNVKIVDSGFSLVHHIFCIVDEDIIVDVTATQFKKERLFIRYGIADDVYQLGHTSYYWWNNECSTVINTPGDLITRQKKMSWPKASVAKEYKEEEL